MAPNAKLLSTSTHPQPQVTMGTSISKSAKENTTSRAPSAIKKFQVTINGPQPLQMSQAHTKDMETASLLEKIAKQDGWLLYSIFDWNYVLFSLSANQLTIEKPSLQIWRETTDRDSTP